VLAPNCVDKLPGPFTSMCSRPDARPSNFIHSMLQPSIAAETTLPQGAALTVDTFGDDLNQVATVALTAGRTVFIKVESFKHSGLQASELHCPGDAFRTRLIPFELAQSRFVGGD
jgi:hypothetical protein